MKATLGGLVRAARRNAGITQELLAEQSRLSVRTVSDIEAGRQPRPKRETLDLLLGALELPPSEMQAIRNAWRSNANTADDVPTLLDPLVGRTREIVKLRRLLSTTRLVTLCGLAGVGKTRLALAAVGEIAEFERVVFVTLSGTTLDDDVAPVALARVGAGSSRDDASAALVGALRGSRTLLVLDSAEHVRAGVIALVRAVTGTEGTSILITSQLPLNIPGERIVIVEPLPIEDSVALIRERAERAGATNPGSTAALAALCEQLNRLPLAIELAAPALRALDAEALRDRLTTGIAMLSDPSGMRRYPTLRDAIAWNYAQLDPEDQSVLRALSTFASAWPLSAAEEICGPDVVHSIDRLVTANIITRMAAGDGSARYWVLSVIRDFAREQLDAAEHRSVQEHHVNCAAKLVGRTACAQRLPAASMATFDDAVMHMFDACIEDMLQAVDAAHSFGMRRQCLAILSGLRGYWPARGKAGWAQQRLESELAGAEAAGDVPPEVLAAAYRAAISLNQQAQRADGPYALRAAYRALELSSTLSADDRCESLLGVMFAAALGGDADAVIHNGETALDIAQDLGRVDDVAAIMSNLAYAFEGRGELDGALAWATRSLRASEASGNIAGIARASAHLAAQYAWMGNAKASRSFGLRALTIAGRLGHGATSAMALRRVATAQAVLGRHRRALRLAILAVRATYPTDAAYPNALTADALGFAASALEPAASLTAFAIADRVRMQSGLRAFAFHQSRRSEFVAHVTAGMRDIDVAVASDAAVSGKLRDLADQLSKVTVSV